MPIISNNVSSASLEIAVPRQTSWHVPRGSYSAQIRSVTLANRISSGARLVRLVFNVNVPGSNLDYLAKIDLRLDLNEGSELWNLLCRLISRSVLQEYSEKTFNLESLVGLGCDVEIGHNCDNAENYDFPLVIVSDVREAGRLVRVECAADKLV